MIKKPKKIVGIDISRLALKRAQQISRGRRKVVLQWGNAENLTKVKDSSFSKIAASELLEHIPYPKKVISEMHRILRDDGMAVISVPNEKIIQGIVRTLKFFRIDKFTKATRKEETYEWHLHSADLQFVKRIIKGKFKIRKVVKIPPILGYRLVISLEKIK